MYSPGQADAHEAFMFIIEGYRGEMSGGLELVEVTEKTLVGGLEHFLFFHIFGIIIPTDFPIFQRGWNHQAEHGYVW